LSGPEGMAGVGGKEDHINGKEGRKPDELSEYTFGSFLKDWETGAGGSVLPGVFGE
jgi:hypothetical protein